MVDAYTMQGNPGTPTPVFDQLLTKFVRASLLSRLQAGLTNLPAGVVDFNTYQVGTDDTYVLPGIADLDVVIPPVLDEILPPPIEEIESYIVSFSTVERARTVGWTSKLQRMQRFNAATEIAGLVSRNVQETIDEEARLIWQATHAGEKVLGGAGTAPLTTDLLIAGVTYLQSIDVPPAANGRYVLITAAEAVADLKKETGEKAWNSTVQQQDQAALESGIIGSWQGADFAVSSRNAPASGTVITSILAGQGALAFADLSSVQTATVLPTPSIADPVGQRGLSSWRMRMGGAVIGRKRRQSSATPVYNYVKIKTLFTAA